MGTALISTDRYQVWIRFENIGNRSRFAALLMDFREQFKLAEWDDARNAWKLPGPQAQKLQRFCRQYALDVLKAQTQDVRENSRKSVQLKLWAEDFEAEPPKRRRNVPRGILHRQDN